MNEDFQELFEHGVPKSNNKNCKFCNSLSAVTDNKKTNHSEQQQQIAILLRAGNKIYYNHDSSFLVDKDLLPRKTTKQVFGLELEGLVESQCYSRKQMFKRGCHW